MDRPAGRQVGDARAASTLTLLLSSLAKSGREQLAILGAGETRTVKRWPRAGQVTFFT